MDLVEERCDDHRRDIDKLIQLRLPHMAAALRAQLERAGSALSVEECVGLMVDREWTERDNRRLGRRIKDAKLGMQACIEDVRCDPARGDRRQLLLPVNDNYFCRFRPRPSARPTAPIFTTTLG